MIDYYLLEAEVSFCVCKSSCHVVWKLPCALSGSSLSSDIATQWHALSLHNAQVSFHPSDVVTCFLLFGGLVFLFPTHSLSLVSLPFWHKCVSGQVSPDECPSIFKSISYLNFLFKLSKFRRTIVSQRVSAKPTAWKRGCGDEYHRKFPIFKKKRECACLQGFTVHGLLHTSYMAASVGPKAQ